MSLDLSQTFNNHMNSDVNHCLNVEKFRKVRNDYMNGQQYRSALFWSDKVVSLSGEHTDDVYQQSICLYHMNEFHRAIHCIKTRQLHKTELSCRHLVAKCHFVTKEYKEALEVLEDDYSDINGKPMDIINNERDRDNDNKWKSSIALLKGQVYEALDNRLIASNCFKEALKYDVFCYEAFYALTKHQMLKKSEEEQLIKSLDFDNQCTKEETKFVYFLYESQLKKYDKPGDIFLPYESSNILQNNVDFMTSLAERHYYNCEYQQCFKITSQVLSKDIYHTQCLPIHLSCLMELKKTNALFDLAHKLVDLYPESSLSWFAVGCYYLLINKTDAARRFLSKATTLDNVLAPAWLLYGHSFAVESEHDQAMAAYFKASHLMNGCHLPLLYIGLEYGLTDNPKLAERFFKQALDIAPNDPFVLHELGVIAYQSSNYIIAEKYFREALNIIKNRKEITVLPDKWEPLLNNMGHVLRKLKRYEEAIDFHKQALILCPQNPSTYSSLGFVYSLMTKWNESVEYFHKALGLKRDDSFSTAMLGHVINHLVKDVSLFKDPIYHLDDNPIKYEQSVVIDDFLASKSKEEKSLPPIKLSNSRLKTTVVNTTPQSNELIPDLSANDCEMDISN
ncbi:cell division cycle protein 16 homolog [Oppia nitens]|uniref:cell division cycle protein 16 homolog n=1 Tax=Oppia nitens TaxID=1686743 RepID=UPI0023DA7146|nr:cell division cycle protein 16 homolog [Oppia nitens]